MTITNQILASYTNGNYQVILYTNGTKIRSYDDLIVPSPVFPESIDVKITDWCDAGCAWCHEKSTTRGNHSNIALLIKLLSDLPRGTEIAIGGGHPLSHPQFDELVTELSNNGIVCNVTVNEFHFEKERERIINLVERGLIKGVGYSYTKIPCEWKYDNLVTHIIIGITPPSEIEKIVRTNKNVLLLGYKQHGRGIKYQTIYSDTVNANIKQWYIRLFDVIKKANISLDNLGIVQLNPRRLFVNDSSYDQFFMGDDGQFTMYIDAVNNTYAISSTSIKQYNINHKTIGECFNQILHT